MPPTLIILKDGSSESDGGRQHLLSNMDACVAVGEAVRTTLGPCGMDKLIVDSGKKVTVSNDGATVMKCLEVVHPAARALVEIAASQDDEVGDGTTSVVLLASEMIRLLKRLVCDGVHPTAVIRAARKACSMAVSKIEAISINVKKTASDGSIHRELLEKCAMTSLNSKLIAQHKDHFAKLVVQAVLTLDQETLPLNMIGIKKVAGGSVRDSTLIEGVAFKKAFSYAGFEMQPKAYKNAKIALLNIELELKAERDNAELRLSSVEDYQRVIDAEWSLLYAKLETLCAAKVDVVLSRLPIGDVATQYFADRNVFCAGRIPEDDLKRTLNACGGCILSTVNDGIDDSVFGRCGKFEEIQIGANRFNVFSDCPLATSCTFVIRGGAQHYMDETERSLHDAIMVVRRTLKSDMIVAGGGASEMEVSRYLRSISGTVPGKDQLIIRAIARAFEIIPRQLCDNAGFDSINALTMLRQKHAERELILTCKLNSPLNDFLNASLLSSDNVVLAISSKLESNSFELRFAINSGAINITATDQYTISINANSGMHKFEGIELSSIEELTRSSSKSINITSSSSNLNLCIEHRIDDKGRWFGIDISKVDSIVDTFEVGIWEPALVKINCIRAATEALALVLSVDQTIRAPRSSNN